MQKGITQQNSLVRHLALSFSIDSMLEEITSTELTPEIEFDLSNKIKSQLNLIFELVQSRSFQLNNTSTVFKELFAHQYCYYLLSGLCDAFAKDSRFTTHELVVKNHGNPIHYLLQIELNGRDFYIDAYGIFPSLKGILKRYQLDDLVVETFDSSDDRDPNFDAYSEACIGHLDQAEGQLEERLDEVDAGITFDYLDHFYLSLASKLFVCLLSDKTTREEPCDSI